MNELPLVSVIIPAYNAESTIETTLKSVLEQSYCNLEVLVVDDGSGDLTAEIVQQVAAKDDRIFFFKQANAGVAAARNLAIEHSQGKYIAPLDADDIWYPQKLEEQVKCIMQAEPRVGLVYTWSVNIDEEDLLTGGFSAAQQQGNVFIDLVCGNFIGNASTPLISRLCLEKVGLYSHKFREQNTQGVEDWDLYLRVAEHYEFQVVPKFLVGYRQISGSMSRDCNSMEKSYKILIKDIQHHHPDISINFYQYAWSNFYNYLAGLSRDSDKHSESLFWFAKALQCDLINLLRPRFYRMVFMELIYLLVQPFISLIGTRQSWLKFTKKSHYSPISLNDINKMAYKSRRSRLSIYKMRLRKYVDYSPTTGRETE